eukprot:321622-Amorphochlora_amoeboformis.AAC.1
MSTTYNLHSSSTSHGKHDADLVRFSIIHAALMIIIRSWHHGRVYYHPPIYGHLWQDVIPTTELGSFDLRFSGALGS